MFSRCPVARRHANTLPTKAAQIPMALRHHEHNFATWSTTHKKQTYRAIPPIIPQTSDTPRLRQHVLRSPEARRQANALSTKAANPNGTVTSRMSCRHTIWPTHYSSISYETSSKSHAYSPPKRAYPARLPFLQHTSSLQNEQFVRDFFKNSHVKVC